MGVHQSDEAPCHPPTEYGGTYDSLYRRHAADGRVHQSGRGSSGSPDVLANRSGLCHQHTQVDHNPKMRDGTWQGKTQKMVLPERNEDGTGRTWHRYPKTESCRYVINIGWT